MKFVQVAVFLFFAVASIRVAADETHPPNIVFILIDDMGWRDVGFAGNAFVETPYIDRLAREGVQFSQPGSAIKGQECNKGSGLF